MKHEITKSEMQVQSMLCDEDNNVFRARSETNGDNETRSPPDPCPLSRPAEESPPLATRLLTPVRDDSEKERDVCDDDFTSGSIFECLSRTHPGFAICVPPC